MNTRSYPRTLQQAFGPHTSSNIEPAEQPMDWQDRLVLAASIASALALVLILVL